MGRRLILKRELPWRGPLWTLLPSCCISPPFGGLSTTRGLMTYVLLTRAPLYWGRSPFSLDLHVLGAPLTFVLSQDQTLQLNPVLAKVSGNARVRSTASAAALVLSNRAWTSPGCVTAPQRASHFSANALCSLSPPVPRSPLAWTRGWRDRDPRYLSRE